VKKNNGKWRVCIDFTTLNEACLKGNYPFLRIDQLVEVTVGHELFSFMDAYYGYNQIKMHLWYEDKTTFTTDQKIYCYKVMPYRFKKAGATFKQIVNKVFKDLIGSTMKV